jgi:hypothetical protein
MNESKRPYRAVVWGHDPTKPGERVTLLAYDLEEAERQLKEKYGEEIVFTLYNEDDADRPR